MDMTGQQTILASRDKVWAALNDPETLRQSIPGCQSLEKRTDSEFIATVVAKLGPVKANFSGKVTLSDIDPPNGYTIQGEGQGGAAGFAKGGAKVALQDDPAGTLLRYEVHAAVGGKLAQIGSRLIDASARKMADDFFSRFNQLVSTAAPPSAGEEALTPAPGIPSSEEPPDELPAAPSKSQAGLPSSIWISGLVIIVILLLIYFGIWH